MQGMTLLEIAKACSGKLCRAQGRENLHIESVEIDSRLVEKDALFIATRGERVDGHSFIPMVEEKGAACVICEKEPEDGTIPYILVENSFQGLKDIAEYYRKTLNIPIIGITGSVGKTSTKEFIAGVLEQKYQVLKTQGNFNNEIGLPLTILKIRSHHQVAVLEMGISEFGEMHRLSKMARPDICVLTNIGQCHLENLKSQEGILKAKSEIFDFMNPEGSIIVNGDDKLLAGFRPDNGIDPMMFFWKQDSSKVVYNPHNRKQIIATDVRDLGLLGSEAMFHNGSDSYDVNIKLPGQHMIYNGLAAACVAQILGLTREQIQKGIEEVKPVSGRSNIIQRNEYTIIDDCYNANPVSVKGALDLLETAIGRKVAILGDMFELGEKEKELHSQIGSYAAKKHIDMLICVGSLSEFMFKEAQNNKNSDLELYYFPTREELLKHFMSLLRPKDAILIKASHGMHFEQILEYL